MPKCQTSLNPEWKIEHEFISKSSRDAFHGFCTLCISVKCVFINFSHSLFVYLCISITSRSPEMLCFQALCTLQDRFISVVSFWNRHHNVLNNIQILWTNTFFASSVTHRSTSRYGRSNCLAMNRVGYFIFTVSWYHRYDGQNCIVVVSTPESYAIILASLNAAKCPPFWCYGNGHPIFKWEISIIRISERETKLDDILW